MTSIEHAIEPPRDLVNGLLPTLGRQLELGFNVFDVMHHGVHEKQISNVFRWLLDSAGTHRLGDRFVRIFLDEINVARPGSVPSSADGYWVRQEVNTSASGELPDIADIVLESSHVSIVVENYFTSDGHGHDFHRYMSYARRDGKLGAVVLLCLEEDGSLQTQGWQDAAVVTYGTLVGRLLEAVADDRDYQRANAEAFDFLQQMHRKFVTGRGLMDDQHVLDFVVAMCDTGEAGRYQIRPQEVAAEQFAIDLADQARHRFGEGRELLQRAKARLRSFAAQHLTPQVNELMGPGFLRGVSARYSGIYQWTINLDIDEETDDSGEGKLQIKFGPSAWFANEQDPHWRVKVDSAAVDYSRLILTRARTRELRQSDVTLAEVLAGLEPNDTRLRDEIGRLMSA